MADEGVLIEHPNREKAAAKATKAIVVVLLLVTAVLLVVITVGGWDVLQGARALQVAYIVLYALSAYLIARWRSGMLPVAAALAMVLLIFAAVSGPEWYERDKEGFTDPALASSLLGLLTLLVVPLQLLLIAFAARGFTQAWHVEVERHPDGTRRTAAGALA